jgi:hypothetical protein
MKQRVMLDSTPLGKLCKPRPRPDILLWQNSIVAAGWDLRPSGTLTAGANAIAFVLLMIWLIWVLELVLRRSRPTTSCGHWAPWRHPSQKPWARMIDATANSRTARYIGELLHAFAMTSDITNVVYINYLVRTERLLPFVPPGLELQRVGPNADHAMFAF